MAPRAFPESSTSDGSEVHLISLKQFAEQTRIALNSVVPHVTARIAYADIVFVDARTRTL